MQSTRPMFAILAILTTPTFVFGQEPGPVGQGLQNAGQAVKRGLQNAGQAIDGGLQTAGNAIQGSFQKTRMSVHNMEVVSRVYSRLHWDKALTTATIELEVRAGGVAILSGVVPDEAAKARAIALTVETVGVVQVVDRLAVAPPGKPATVIEGSPAPVIVSPPGSPSGDRPI